VSDAVQAIERFDADGFFQIAELARSASDFKLAVRLNDGDAGRIVAAILKAFEAFED
jgi:hypothetical protein